MAPQSSTGIEMYYVYPRIQCSITDVYPETIINGQREDYRAREDLGGSWAHVYTKVR